MIRSYIVPYKAPLPCYITSRLDKEILYTVSIYQSEHRIHYPHEVITALTYTHVTNKRSYAKKKIFVIEYELPKF